MQLKDILERAVADIGELEQHVRGAIENANIADIIAAGAARLRQASEHPDAALIMGGGEPHPDLFPVADDTPATAVPFPPTPAIEPVTPDKGA